MIKIIKGTYGYVDGNGAVQPKTAKDGPFSLTKEQEKRLVDQGVAEYVGAKAPAATEVKTEEVKAEEPAKKTSGKKSGNNKKKETTEEPPVLEAADPE